MFVRMLRLSVFLLAACSAFAQYGIARKVITGAGAPSSSNCNSASEVGNVYARNNAAAAFATFYVCANTAASTYAWELYSSGTVNSGIAGSLAYYQTGGTGISALSTGSGILNWLTTPSSALLRTALTDETGTGSAVFATSPTLVTPILGTPTSGTATNITGLPLTTGVTGILPIANGGTGVVALFATNAQTSTYQVLAADFAACKTITVASGTFTITLVASGSQPTTGQCITILNYGAGVVTLARSGQNINGAASNLTGTAGSATGPTGWRVYSDGTNYFAQIIGGAGTTYSAGAGMILTGTVFSPDTAVMLSNATDQAGTRKKCTSATGNDTYTCTLTPTLTAYSDPGCVLLNPDTANTGAATLNIDGLGAKNILTRALATPPDSFVPASINTELCYDGTQFVPPSAGNGVAVMSSTSVPYLLESGLYYGGNIFQMNRPSDYGSFSWGNQGGSTVTTTNGAMYFSFPATTGANLRRYMAALPGGTSWTLTAAYMITAPATNNQYCGIGLYESGTTKSVILGTQAQTTVQVTNFANDTTASSTSYAVNWGAGTTEGKIVWVKIVRSGATLAYSRGANPNSFLELFSGATTAFFTTAPDNAGIFCDVNNGSSNAVVMSLLSFTIV